MLFRIIYAAFLVLSTCVSLESLAQTKPAIQALFSNGQFLNAGKSAFLETYLMVRGSSVKFKKNQNDKYQGVIEVILTLNQGDKLVYVDKYNLHSPETDDSTRIRFNFIDQQRIAVENGVYELGVSIRDLNGSAERVDATSRVHVNFPVDSISISDIELIESYEKANAPSALTKGGYSLIPHISELYSGDETKLVFYAEIYNTLKHLGAGERFLLNYSLEDVGTGTSLKEKYSGFKVYETSEVKAFLNEIPIENLPSGNYKLLLEIRDKNNALLAQKKQAFVRTNPEKAIELETLASLKIAGSFTENYKNPDSLAEHIRCLAPISSEMEKSYARNLLRSTDLSMMQHYFLGFWLNRDTQNPQTAWETYHSEVKKAQKFFATSIKKAYNTDRGRVFLQYGPPDNRTIGNREPTAYPYEIWQYYKLNKQTNRRFVFYNPDLVTNDYSLIHSDALGEIMNDQWQRVIVRRDTQNNDIDNNNVDSHYGTQIQQNFLSPR